MRLFRSWLITGISLVFLCGGIGLGPPEAQAASKKLKDLIVTNKDLKELILMLKDQVNMLKDQIDNLPESEPCAVPTTWSEEIPGNEQFVPTTFVDANGEQAAYCDRQTGLVWETGLSTNLLVWGDAQGFINATRHCLNRLVGTSGQKGWRLPSIVELASLVDTTSASCTVSNKCIPDGSLFDILSVQYWSTTEVADSGDSAWFVVFLNGGVALNTKDFTNRAWCVRGAMQESEY